MSVKQFEWPFKENPHTLQIQHDGDKYSFAICDAERYVFITPGNIPELVTKVGNKIIKTPLKLLSEH